MKCVEQWDSEVNDFRDLEFSCNRKFRLYAALFACLFCFETGFVAKDDPQLLTLLSPKHQDGRHAGSYKAFAGVLALES